MKGSGYHLGLLPKTLIFLVPAPSPPPPASSTSPPPPSPLRSLSTATAAASATHCVCQRRRQDVDVEGLQDAAVYQLPDAGHHPGRPPAGGQVHGIRSPHEPRPRRLRGVPPPTPCQILLQEAPPRRPRPSIWSIRGARGSTHPRPRPPPRRGGRLHDRRGPTSPGRVPRQGRRCRRARGPRRGARCRPRCPHCSAGPGPAGTGGARARCRGAGPRHDAAPDLSPAGAAAVGAPGGVPAAAGDAPAPGCPDARFPRAAPAHGPGPSSPRADAVPWQTWRPRSAASLPGAPSAVWPAAYGAATTDDAGSASASKAWNAASARGGYSSLWATEAWDAASATPAASAEPAVVFELFWASEFSNGVLVQAL